MTLEDAARNIRDTLSVIDQVWTAQHARVVRIPAEIRAQRQEQLDAISRGIGDAEMELRGALYTVEKLAASLPNLSQTTEQIVSHMEQQAQLPHGAMVMAYGRERR